jgi:hypothetical protein
MRPEPRSGLHVTTLAHGGRIWETYLEFADDPHRPDSYRARLRFEAADGAEGEQPVRTGVIIIEPSYEEAVQRARAFDGRQLEGLLRSALPGEDDEE